MLRVGLGISGRTYLWPRQKVILGCVAEMGCTCREGFQGTPNISMSAEILSSQFTSREFQAIMIEMIPRSCGSKPCLDPMLQSDLLQSPESP